MTHESPAFAESCRRTLTVRQVLGPRFPKIVCLCGSTRFWQTFRDVGLRETLAGRIVLSVGAATASDTDHGITRDQKFALDELHMFKIELADEVLILNVGGYVGDSTGNNLARAIALKKKIRTLEPMDLAAWLQRRQDEIHRITGGTRGRDGVA